MTRKIFLLITLALVSYHLQAQFIHKKVNQYDENGYRTGKWITFWDEEEKIPMSKINFKNGRETGVSKEYYINGRLRLKFRYHHSRLRVKYYYENRKLEQKGWAVIEYNKEDTHYYWHGPWKFYSQKRKLTRISHYENGEEVNPQPDKP